MLSFDIGCNPPQPIIQDGHDFEAEGSEVSLFLCREFWVASLEYVVELGQVHNIQKSSAFALLSLLQYFLDLVGAWLAEVEDEQGFSVEDYAQAIPYPYAGPQT